MNDIITSIIEHIDSNLSYKFNKGKAPGDLYSSSIARYGSLRKDFIEAIAKNSIEVVDLCGLVYCFIMQGDVIVVYREWRTSETDGYRKFPSCYGQMIECYRFNISDDANNDIEKLTAMFVLEQLKNLPHDKEDLVLDKLLDCICLADSRLSRHQKSLKIKSEAGYIVIVPKLVYPNYSRSRDSARLLCLEYCLEDHGNKYSTSYNFDDIRCFKKIIKWLAKDKFNNCINRHTSSHMSDQPKI